MPGLHYNILITGAGSGLGASFVSTLESSGPPRCTIYAIDIAFPDGEGSSRDANGRARSDDMRKQAQVANAGGHNGTGLPPPPPVPGSNQRGASPDGGADRSRSRDASPMTKEGHKRSVSSSSGHSPRVKKITMDISMPSHISRLTELLDNKGVGLHLVIHCAGIRGLVDTVPIKKPSDISKAETVEIMDADTMNKAFSVNATGTFLVLQSLIPALKRGYETGTADQTHIRIPKVIVMGSRMASISHNDVGGGYAYRASKAALNAIVRSFAFDVKQAIWTVVHPGRVETGLVGVKEDGAAYVGHSTGDILTLMRSLELKDTGRFMDRHGKDIAW